MKGTKGFRVPAQSSKKQAMNNLETEIANLQMAGRISQMMTQQLMQNIQGMTGDLNAAMQQVMELRYKLDAVQKHLNIDNGVLNEISNAQRLIDFNDAAVKADVKENLIAGDVVSDDSTITITSVAAEADGSDRGIFRSRIKLSESGAPELIQLLQGKKVGDKVVSKLNGLDHTVELLAIRNPAPQPLETEVVQ